MATITPTFNAVSARGDTAYQLLWSIMASADTITELPIGGKEFTRGAVQFSGTFGGATVKLQVSNDGTTYYDMKDVSGATVSVTAAGYFEFQTAGIYLRPSIAGGTGDAVTATVILREG